ncbi:MAG TPA: hypothetical protein P5027_02025 [Flavobacteriales bacterium]|nr:hypothetical protein [Flavobacteriales bacterium]
MLKTTTTTGKLLLGSFVALLAMGPMTSCKKKEGCTDPTATNYDPDADKDDGSCVYPETGTNDPTVSIGGETYYVVTTPITSNKTLTSDKKWYISGGVFVNDGITLTIDAGTEVFAADDGTTPFISILRGGMIMAEGTATDPIRLTTIKTVTGGASAGDWGGLILNGRATINIGATAEGEGGTGTYGGSNDADNSGVLRYVRVEYAGKILGTDNELNGFSFNAVGNQTVLEHLQAYRGADDGFEFFGGAARLKWAVSTGNTDDSFDWTHGWRGRGQFWVVHQDPTAGDRCMECDNWEIDYMVTPFSDPMVSNFTLVNNGNNDAVRLRHGTRGMLYNGLVAGTGAGDGIEVSDTSSTWMDQGLLVVKNTDVFNFGTNWKNCAPFENDATNGTADPGLNGFVGTATGGVDPTTLDPWFSAGTFKGAVDGGDDWTTGWTLPL